MLWVPRCVGLCLGSGFPCSCGSAGRVNTVLWAHRPASVLFQFLLGVKNISSLLGRPSRNKAGYSWHGLWQSLASYMEGTLFTFLKSQQSLGLPVPPPKKGPFSGAGGRQPLAEEGHRPDCAALGSTREQKCSLCVSCDRCSRTNPSVTAATQLSWSLKVLSSLLHFV